MQSIGMTLISQMVTASMLGIAVKDCRGILARLLAPIRSLSKNNKGLINQNK